jgi:DNA recombination protein RmuC
VRLERILESSGLIRNKEFVVQGEGLNIKSEDGSSQRPDVVILLPENRHFIIDSKVSLVSYLEYEAATDENDKAAKLKNVLTSVKGHIDGLASKKYQYAEAINSHDLVFMFVPIEGVASLLLQNDDSLYDYAWKKKIVLVSPSTLFMVMQTVSSIWRYERQSENALQIADQAGLLYDKLVGAVESFNQVASHLSSASDAHSEAMKKLASGRGNALQKAEKLKILGATSKKSLPSILISGEKIAIETDDDHEDPSSEPVISASAS